jgi:peptidyl-tRNA hydrolase
VVVRYGGAVSWQANRQKVTLISSMESEIYAAAEAAKEVGYMEKVAQDLSEQPAKPVLYCDNYAAIA